MGASCDEAAERARKNLSLILTRLSSVGQARAAEAIGVSESTVSKLKSGDLEMVAKLLAAIGVKCVPGHVRCYEPKQIEAVLALAKARLSQIESADQLAWEE